MTSKLSDAEVAAQLREMGQDIGPMNDSTRGVYRRKLERLLLEQSILSTPPKEPQQTKAREKGMTQGLAVITNAEEEDEEDDSDLDESPEGSLRLEDDELDEDFMEDDLSGGFEPERSEFGVREGRPLNNASSARERKFQDSGDIYAAGRNPFASEMTNRDLPSTFDSDMAATKRATSHANRVLYDDEASRKEPVVDRYLLCGTFSPAPLATPTASRSKRADADMSQLRQRTTVPPGKETTNNVGSYDRVALKPEECVPSPRNPLSTYLDRCTPPPSTAPQSIRHADHAARVQQTKPKDNGMLFWIIAVAVAVICILGLLVLYNMEPGYTNPMGN